MAFLEPDRYFSRLSHVNVERDILALGYANVLLDVDNTILTRDTHEVPRDVGFWLAHAREAGIAFCLVSNNWHRGVYDLAARLDLPIVAKAVKPLPPAFVYAMSKIKANRKNTLVIGDQLVTDVLGAHALGMKAYLLAPLVEQDLPHTLLLRNLERAIMGDRAPEGVSGASFDACMSDEDGQSEGDVAGSTDLRAAASEARTKAGVGANAKVNAGAKDVRSMSARAADIRVAGMVHLADSAGEERAL